MKKNALIITGVVIVGAILAFFFYSDKKAEVIPDDLVVSSDGVLALQIPEDALPAGVSRSDISIAPSTFTTVDENQDKLLAYELSLNGLEFTKPITVTFKSSLTKTDDGYVIPLLLHKKVNGEEVETEIIDNTYVEINQEDNSLIVKGDISHFSEIALWEVKGIFSGEAKSDSTTHGVGESFKFKAVVKPTKQTDIFRDNYGYDEFGFAWGTTWGISGKLATSYARIISPEEQDILERRGLTIHQPYEVTGDFTCDKTGRESVGAGWNDASAKIRYTINHKRWSTFGGKLELLRENNTQYTTRINFSEYHRCGEAGAGEDTYVSLEKTATDPSNLNCSGIELLAKEDGGTETSVYKLKDGKCYAAEQFHTPSNPDECKEVHYHYTLQSIDGHFRNDSDPCGAAVASDIVGRGVIWIK